MPWNPKSAKGNWISYSEARTLGHCEEQWRLQYREHEDREPSDKMLLGTLLHVGAAAFWQDVCVDAAVDRELYGGEDFVGREVPDWVGADADWLMDRYMLWYADMRSDVKAAHSELELTATLPGTKVKVMGHVDEMWEVDGKLWLVERKSYGSRDRLDLLPVDPQISAYCWLARENGLDVYGVVFDGIYTYHWKPEKPTQKQMIEDADGEPWLTDERYQDMPAGKAKQAWARDAVEAHPGVDRPLSESFDLVYLDRTPEQMDEGANWLKAAVSRRNALRRGATPMRNVGPLCKGCRAKDRCFAGLAFPRGDIELDLS